MTLTHRLVVLSGPSCVGKSPLHRALARLYPELEQRLQKLVLYNSRHPRPGERDGVAYHFRRRDEIKLLGRDKRYVVLEVRGDLQALDLEEVERLLSFGDVFFEGNPFVGELLCTHPRLADLPRLSVFVSPLSRAEISELRNPDRHVNLEALVTDLMRRKLLRRTRRQKGELALSDLEDIRRRAGSAYRELRTACRFDHVLCNHDGEDSDHWDAFYYPLGDARRVLLAFADLLQGNVPAEVEEWEADLIP